MVTAPDIDLVINGSTDCFEGESVGEISRPERVKSDRKKIEYGFENEG